MDPYDVEQLRLRPEDRPKAKSSTKPPRHKSGEWFLKGPIPGSWLAKSMRHTYAAMRVGIALWYLAGCHKSREVKPTWFVWQQFGIPREVAHRGLERLERAGLVRVDRHRGRCPIVTILDVSE